LARLTQAQQLKAVEPKVQPLRATATAPTAQPVVGTPVGQPQAVGRRGEVVSAPEITQPTAPVRVYSDTGQPKTITAEQQLMLSNLSGKALFDQMKSLGIIQKEAVYVEGGFVPADVAKQIKEASPELYDVLERGGIEAFKKKAEELQKRAEAEYEREKARFEAEQKRAEVEYKKQLSEFEAGLKDAPQELQDAYKKGGIEAYNKAVKDLKVKYGKEYEQNIQKWLAQWKDYPEVALAYKEKGIKHAEFIAGMLSAESQARYQRLETRYTKEKATYDRGVAEFEAEVFPTLPPDLQLSYTKGKEAGDFTLYNKNVEAYNLAIEKLEDRIAKAKAALRPYKAPLDISEQFVYEELKRGVPVSETKKKLVDFGSYTIPGIARFLREKPKEEIKLKTLGLSDESIKAAKEYNKQPWIMLTESEKWWEKVKEAGGAGLNVQEFIGFLQKHPELAEAGRQATLAPIPVEMKPIDVSLSMFIRLYMEEKGVKPLGLFEFGDKKQNQTKQEAMGKWNIMKLSPQGVELARKTYIKSREEAGLPPSKKFEWSHIWETPKLTPEQETMLARLREETDRISKLPLHKQWIETAKLDLLTEAKSMGVVAATLLPMLRFELEKVGKDLPTPLRIMTEVVGGVALGALVAAPIYMAGFASTMLATPFVPKKGQYLAGVAGGVAEFFLGIPAMVVAKPSLALGELIGVFVVGPMGALKLIKTARAAASPWYVPKRGISIEYSVLKIPVKGIGKPALIRAVNKAIRSALRNPKGEATVNIAGGKLQIKIKSTPVSEVVGPALYHSTPLITQALLKGKVRGQIYTSPQAALRFADLSATGVPATKPAVLMIYTKAKGSQWYPSNWLYKMAKEVEAIFPTMKLTRVRNLRSRLLGANAGEFITVQGGRVIQIFRFAEKGAKVPKFGMKQLALVRLKVIRAVLLDILKGKKGYEIIKRSTDKVLLKRLEKVIADEVGRGRPFERAVNTALRAELLRLYRANPALLTRYYGETPSTFENLYVAYLDRELSRLPRGETRVVPRESIALPSGEYRAIPRRWTRVISIPRRVLGRPRRAEAPVIRVVIPPRERIEVPPREEVRIPPRERIEVPPREEVRIPPRERIEVPPREPPRIPPREPPVPPIEPPPPVPMRRRRVAKEKVVKPELGKVTWYQGKLKIRGELKPQWYVVSPPYKTAIDIHRQFVKPKDAVAVGGVGAAYKTIQQLGGNPDILLNIDFGAFDVRVKTPRTRGERGALRFKRDVNQRTKMPISVKEIRTVRV